MIDVSKLGNEQVPLCICMLSIAILGCLGYHAVRWVIKRRDNFEEIDHLVQKTTSSSLRIFPQLSGSEKSVEALVDEIALQQKSERKKTLAAVKIQSVYRGYKARLILKNLQSIRSKSCTIVDAKDSGMEYHDVLAAINTLAKKELKDDEGWISASNYVKKKYFNGIFIAPGLSSPETILLAKAGKEIIGFIITAKREDDEDSLSSFLSDTGYVAYLAVDSKVKRSGVGTKLMLAAMNQTKQLGKRYLTLEYIAKGLGVDENRGKAKIGFYKSFSSRFGIPMKEKGNVRVTRQLHVHPYYDLRDVDFSLIKKICLT